MSGREYEPFEWDGPDRTFPKDENQFPKDGKQFPQKFGCDPADLTLEGKNFLKSKSYILSLIF